MQSPQEGVYSLPQKSTGRSGSDLFIVDNSDDLWKVEHYLHEWTDISTQFDIATGFFEIGALLSLEGQWQKLDKLRILMGDEVSLRTKKALQDGINFAKQKLDNSIETEKEKNDFLSGVPAIVDALRRGQIECRGPTGRLRTRRRACLFGQRNPDCLGYATALQN